MAKSCKTILTTIKSVRDNWALAATVLVAILSCAKYIGELHGGKADNSSFFAAAIAILSGIFAFIILLLVIFHSTQLHHGVSGWPGKGEKAIIDALGKDVLINRKGQSHLAQRLKSRPLYLWPANDTDIYAISMINSSAFRGTPFGGSTQAKFERNVKMWHKNNHVFLALKKPPESKPGPIFFFSCIIPLTAEGYNDYFDGLAGDNDFPDHWIAPPGTKAVALLIFTIAHDKSLHHNVRHTLGPLTPYYLHHIAFHLQMLIDDHFPDKTAMVLFQNSSRAFKGIHGFVATNKQTNDKETVYKMRLQITP